MNEHTTGGFLTHVGISLRNLAQLTLAAYVMSNFLVRPHGFTVKTMACMGV